MDLNISSENVKTDIIQPVHKTKNNRQITESEKIEVLIRYSKEKIGDIAKELGLTPRQAYRVIYTTRKHVTNELKNNIDNLDIETVVQYKKLLSLVKSKRGRSQRKTTKEILGELVDKLDL